MSSHTLEKRVSFEMSTSILICLCTLTEDIPSDTIHDPLLLEWHLLVQAGHEILRREILGHEILGREILGRETLRRDMTLFVNVFGPLSYSDCLSFPRITTVCCRSLSRPKHSAHIKLTWKVFQSKDLSISTTSPFQ